MILFLILTIIIFYILCSVQIFKKKNIYYIYFWFFLTTIVIFISLLLLIINAYKSQEIVIRNKKQEYQDILDLDSTKIYIDNKIIENDEEIKEILRSLRIETRFVGYDKKIGNTNIKITNKNKEVNLNFYIERDGKLCRLYLEKNNSKYFLLGEKKSYCDILKY
jgi:energy-coupling factor transporter transmembrane protein EcfT